MEHLYCVGWNGVLCAPSVGVAKNVVSAILIVGLRQNSHYDLHDLTKLNTYASRNFIANEE